VIDTSYDNYCQLWVQFMTTGCSKLVAKEKAGTHQANRGFRGCHQSCSGDTEVTESGVAYPNCMDKAEAMSALVVGICGAAPLSHLGLKPTAFTFHRWLQRVSTWHRSAPAHDSSTFDMLPGTLNCMVPCVLHMVELGRSSKLL
jgi:hypothetical protein